MTYELQFIKALGVTIVVETIVLFALCKFIFTSVKASNSTILLTGITPSFATLPYLWFLLPMFMSNKIMYLAAGESFVVVTESLIIMGLLRITYTKSLLISLICNTASYLVGFWLMNI